MDQETLLVEIQRLADAGLYRQAYELTQQLAANLPQRAQWIDQIRRNSKAAIDSARGNLNQLLDDLQTPIDSNFAESFLDEWRNAMLGGEDPALVAFQNRVANRLADDRNEELYQIELSQVLQYWQQAENDTRNNASSNIILDKYTRAREVVRRALSTYGGNDNLRPRFEALLEQAENRRNLASTDEETMASGALLGQYERVFARIDATEEGHLLPIFDKAGNRQNARRSKAEARAYMQEVARDFVKDKVREHTDKIQQYLEEGSPRRAQEELTALDKYEALKSYVPNLVASRDQQLINTYSEDIRRALRDLEQAESDAQIASETAKEDALEGWRQLAGALELYQGVRQSDIVREVIRRIETIARRQLREDHTQFESLLNQHDYDAVSSKITQLKRRYEPLNRGQHPDNNTDLQIGRVNLTTEINNLDVLKRRADVLMGERNDVLEELDRISNQVMGNPQGAKRDLRTLERSEQREMLQIPLIATRYEEVKSQVNRVAGRQEELDRLEGFLNNRNPTRIQEAIKSARTAANDPMPDAGEFENLAQNLEVNLYLLGVDDQLREKGYEAVIKQLQIYNSSSVLRSEVKRPLETRLTSLIIEAETLDDRQSLLQDAQDALEQRKYREARTLLNDLEVVSIQDRRQRDQLLRQVRSEWLEALKYQFDHIVPQVQFDVEVYDNALNDLRELDANVALTVERRYNVLKTIQLARIAEAEGNWAEAKELWQQAYNRVMTDREQREYIKLQMEHLNVLQMERDIEEALAFATRVTERGITDEETQLELNGRLIALGEKTINEGQNIKNPVDQLQMAVWRAQLLIAHAQSTPDRSRRRALFRELNTFATTFELKLKSASQSGNAKGDDLKYATRLHQAADNANELSAAVDTLENDLTANASFNAFVSAHQRWQRSVVPYVEILPILRLWYNNCLDQVSDQLLQQVTDERGLQKDPDISNIPWYGKLLVLKPNDDLVRSMFARIGSLGTRLASEVRTFITRIENESRGVGDQDKEQFGLVQQVENIRQKQAEIQVVSDVIHHFKDLDTIVQDKGLDETLQTQNQVLRTLGSLLNQFSEASRTDFEPRLKNYQLPLDSWRNTPATLKADLWDPWHERLMKLTPLIEDRENQQFNAPITNINLKLEEHFWYKALQAQFETLKSAMDQLVKILIQVEELTQQQGFETADQRASEMKTESLILTLFERMQLYDQYTVIDPQNQSKVVGWDQVKALLSQRLEEWRCLRQWADELAVPEQIGALSSGEAGTSSQVTPEQGNALSGGDQLPAGIPKWDGEDGIDKLTTKLRSTADFEQALGLIEDAYAQYEAAYEQAKSAPMPDGSYTEDYAAVQRAFGYERARLLLQWTEQHRKQACRNLRDKAKTRQLELKTLAQDWENTQRAMSGALTTLSMALNDRNWRGGYNEEQKNVIRKALATCETTLNKLRGIAGKAPEIENFDKNKFLTQARQIIG
ncbi:MAG: hypothetical protein MUF87_12675 [Anaerolineae bacterium]|jgi:hypothetical protein|nr:hypothetical protein [Anaerolineae bacterium]